ncbi:MAG TPA: polysaccharide deacetylase family protein, partial [Dehalococcoidia bacterium]|nr:polysaccharide deacetylase family protein [Dehalococcoidia bacterium]
MRWWWVAGRDARGDEHGRGGGVAGGDARAECDGIRGGVGDGGADCYIGSAGRADRGVSRDASRRAIALPFDAGSDAGYTEDILRTLRAQGIRASFSVTGLWAEANPELLNSIAADGHVLINHSHSHPSFTGRSTGEPPLTAQERALQLSRVETTVYRLTSRSTRPYFRPPFGDFDASVAADAAAAGFPVVVMWTVDTFGWNGATAEQIIERTMALAGPGAIVIMHVGSE